MKILLRITKFIYLLTIYLLLLIIWFISWPIRRFLQWLYLIDEDYLIKAPMTTFVEMKIRQNKRINLNFLFNANIRIIEWFNKKIHK